MANIAKLALAVFAAALLSACAQQEEPMEDEMVVMEPEPVFTGKP